jgi:predicted RNA-binding protein YlxR (DUF448 family)
MRRKHVPQRTCIGCHEGKAKRELVRLVRTPEGDLAVDETGRRNGRGAYLCRRRACWESALKSNQIGKALKMEIGEAERQMLREYMAAL